MSTPALVDLVCHLYERSYGKIGANLLRILLDKGRSSLPELAKLTGLPVSAVQRTLVSMITNRFVLFWKGPRTFYFANWRQVYFILWAGEILNDESECSKNLILQAITEGQIPAKSLPENSTDDVEKHLRVVSDWEFWPAEELAQSIEQKSKSEISNDPSAFGKSETAKKQLISVSTQNEISRIHGDIGTTGSDQQYYVVDWDKFLIKARRKELIAYASRVVGGVTSKLYEIVLKLSESSIKTVREIRVPALDTSITTQTIVNHLDEGLIAELKEVFQSHEGDNAINDQDAAPESSAKRAKLNAGNAKAAVLASMSPAELVNKHLQLLASVKSARFIQRIGGRQQGEWFVPFDRVVDDLQRNTLDEIIAQSLGEPAARLVRLIRASGKLDEKMLGNQALLPALEIRHQMSALANFGFADIQELAKPNERGGAPASGAQKRSLFLWYHRPKWSYARLLDMLYVQLKKNLEELDNLRATHNILLAKLTREDVLSDIDQFLTAKEHEELQAYRQAEHAIYKRMNMIDRNVRIFREY